MKNTNPVKKFGIGERALKRLRAMSASVQWGTKTAPTVRHLFKLPMSFARFAIALGAILSRIIVSNVSADTNCVPPPSGLVSWWRAEGNADDAVGTNHGTLQNGAGFAAGNVGQAFSFNGTNDYVLVPDSPSLRPTDFTIEGWFKFSSLGGIQILVSKAFGTGTQESQVLYLNAGLLVGAAGGANMSYLTYALNPTPSVWYHIAYTFDDSSNSQRLYVNGVQVASGANNYTIGYDAHPVTLGAEYESETMSYYLHGKIDEASIYNRALTTNEIQAIYAAGRSGKCVPPPPPCATPPSGLVSWWRAENDATDSVGANDGTLLSGISFAGGEVGQAFIFNGTPAGVRVPANSSLNVGACPGLTVEMWVKPANLSPQPLVEWNANTGDSGIGAHFWISAGPSGPGAAGSLFVNLVDNGGGSHFVSTAGNVVFSNVFQHVAFTYNKASGLVVIYWNGVVVSTQSVGSLTPQTSFDFYLGRRASGYYSGNFFGLGAIDEASIYNRALAANEIQAIYNAGAAGKCAVPIPPTITLQPVNQTVTVGGTANFSVTATGTTPLAYQWRFGAANLSGASSSSLTLTNVQLTNAGTYSVLVSNSAGTVVSSNATLTVNPPPICIPAPSGLISWWPGNSNANEIVGGNNGTWAGNMAYGSGKVSQGFALDGTSGLNVSNAASFQLQDFTIETWIKRASTTLTTKRPWPNSFDNNGVIFSSGAYKGYVFFLNGSGRLVLGKSMVSSVTLTSPRITDTNFHHVAVTKSSSVVMFYIDGVGYSVPAYGPVFDATTTVGIGTHPEIQQNCFWGTIDELAFFDRALTTNEIQAIYNASSAGKCKEPPAIVAQPVSQKVTVGMNATFHVVASGTPQLRYQWRFNGDAIAGATDSMLSFTVSDSSGGFYSVRVTNAFGSVISSNAVLTVNHPPVADASATKPLLIVPPGCPLTAVLDGSRSYDPDGDALQYRWFKAGETNPLATGVVAVVTLPLGMHSLTLVVDDGLAKGTQTFTVELITPAQAIERLIALVKSQAQRPNPLVVTLEAALASVERDNVTPAINQLEAFQNKVRAQVAPDDPALAGRFIQAAQDIIDALRRDCAATKPHGKIGKVQRHGNGNVRIEFSAPGALYVVEASTNLVDWEQIGMATDRGDGTFDFEDANAAQMPTRFYRIVAP